MKKPKKHIFSIFLILSSIALLLVFQYFWLRKVYEDEKTTLQKQIDLTFRTVMMAMQDSLLQKNIKAIGDSNFKFNFFRPFEHFRNPAFFQKDTTKHKDRHIHIQSHLLQKVNKLVLSQKGKATASQTKQVNKPNRKDTLIVSEESNIQVFITSDKPQDSLNTILRKIAIDRPPEMQTKSFVIRLGNDTLARTSIIANYQKALLEAKIDLPFELQVLNHQQERENFFSRKTHEGTEKGILSTPFFTIPSAPIYQVYFPDSQIFILWKMLPQFVFSLLLVLLTSGAFYLIYHNLQKQEKLITLKNDFISNVTHELKTPVTTVSVAIEALQNFNALQNPTLTKEYLEISQNELNRLAMLVDKIMKMSSFESKGIELKLSTIDLPQLINQILKSMKLQFEKYKAVVSFEVTQQNESESLCIQADEVHLTNVIYNLLDNALKYSKENPNIAIQLIDLGNKIQLSVKDNGIGIASEYRDKIFEKFFRVPTGNIHNIKGYGLGLSYVASVIQQHGGRIQVESRVGQGSCFRIELKK
jgi:signal transduction histidine kinase